MDPPTGEKNNASRVPLLERDGDYNDAAPIAMTALEEELPVMTVVAGVNNRTRVGGTPRPTLRSSSSRLFANQLVGFQIGLLSLILWVPTLTLPLVRWTYKGVLAHLDDSTASNSSFHIVLWQLPYTIWAQGIGAGTAIWILVVVWITFVTTVVVVPLLASVLAAWAWIHRSERCKLWLHCLHPVMGSGFFCLALLMTVPALLSWSRVAMLDDGSGGLCRRILLGQDCLSLDADFRPGMWVFVVHSLALEIFVVLALQ
jgi:hypothetical protein